MTKQYKSACTHRGAAPVLILNDKCTIVAGSAWDINDSLDELKPDILISVGGRDLAVTAKEQMVTFDLTTQKAFKNTYAMTPKRWKPKGSIVVDWPDMGVPPMDREWWDALMADLNQFEGTVAIFCMGGHGRTGTTLSILAALSGVCPGEDPVEWVRDVWCEEAVESEKQVKYLHELGIKTDAKPSKVYTSVNGGGGYYQGLDDFGDIGLDPDEAEALTALMVGTDGPKGKKIIECDVCLEDGAAYDSEERLWLCKPCSQEREFIRSGKTPEEAKKEADPDQQLCKDCANSPAYWSPTYQDYFCDVCVPLPGSRSKVTVS